MLPSNIVLTFSLIHGGRLKDPKNCNKELVSNFARWLISSNESRRRLDHSTLEGNIVKYPKVVVGSGQLVGMAGGRDLSLLAGRAGEVGLGSGPRNRWLLLAGRTVARTGAFLRQGGLLGPEIVKE